MYIYKSVPKVLESRRGSGIRKVLRSAAPTCPEVIRACQLASRQILRGEDCCRLFFKQFRYQPGGYCIEGQAAQHTPPQMMNAYFQEKLQIKMRHLPFLLDLTFR